MRSVLGHILGVLAGVLFGISLYAGSALIKPPANCSITKIGGKPYFSGTVYLGQHADTAALKPFGFRKFEFIGRSMWSVRYSAVWPTTIVLDSLPDLLTGIDYDVDEDPMVVVKGGVHGEPVAIYYDWDGERVIEKADGYSPYRRIVVADLKDLSAYGATKYDGDATKDGRFRKPSELIDKSRFYGNFPARPYEGKPFRKVEDVIVKGDPNIGWLHTRPVESGRYHKPSSVVTRDHPAVGTFHTRPDPSASTLRPTDFGILKRSSFLRPGRSTFGPSPSGIQDWQRVGVNNRPRTISMQEWRRQHGQRP